jgi:hypothetical protein
MELHLGADDQLRLVDQDNFRAFKLVVEQPKTALAHVKKVLSGTILVSDTETAWVSETALRHLSGHAHDHEWHHKLAAMIEKAKPHGWIDEVNQAIKAHIEWQE